MTFLCNGCTYSTAHMRTFQTGDADLPVIYLTHDGRCTFVTRREPDGSMEVYRAGTAEIISLARRYRLDGLLGAFPAAFAPAEILLEAGDEIAPLAVEGYSSGGVAVSGAGARE